MINPEKILLRKGTLITLNGILIIAVIFLSLLIMRDLFASPGYSATGISGLSGADKVSKGNTGFDDYAVIIKRNPFGFDAGHLSALTVNTEKSNNSGIGKKYELIGTIATGGDDSFAVFLRSDGKQVLFRISDKMPGLGILEEITPRSVMIRGQGGKNRMYIRKIKSIHNSRDAGRTASRRGNKGVFARKGNDGSFVLNSNMVQESISNPQRLMTDARLFPRYKNGKQQGFLLKEVKKGGIYDSLGLRNGDILLRVNEYDITNPESALQAFTALKGVDTLKLDIIRGGARITQTYYIR